MPPRDRHAACNAGEGRPARPVRPGLSASSALGSCPGHAQSVVAVSMRFCPSYVQGKLGAETGIHRKRGGNPKQRNWRGSGRTAHTHTPVNWPAAIPPLGVWDFPKSWEGH